MYVLNNYLHDLIDYLIDYLIDHPSCMCYFTSYIKLFVNRYLKSWRLCIKLRLFNIHHQNKAKQETVMFFLSWFYLYCVKINLCNNA